MDVIDTMNKMNSYNFKIQVISNNFLSKANQEKVDLKKPSEKAERSFAKVFINQVTREGTATLKIIAGNG